MTGVQFMTLDQLLGRSQPSSNPILPEAQIMELRAALARYEAGCPFKAGDLVTPRQNSQYNDIGLPFVVVEVYGYRFSDNDDTERNDMRVVHVTPDGKLCPHNVEAWQFEPYTGEPASDKPS